MTTHINSSAGEVLAVATDTEPDLRTRIAAALADEDARNWGYDHGFEPGDAETLGFADAAIAVVRAELAGQAAAIEHYETALTEAARDAEDDDEPTRAALIETIAAADADRDRLESELAEARAEAKAARAENARLGGAVELWLDNGTVREARAEALRAEIAGYVEPPPLPTTEDYRVVVRDEDSADEPHGGWQLVSSTQPTLAAAVRRMGSRRRNWPDSPEMRVWRRQDVWSVAAVETRDASRAPESPADAPTPRATPDA